MWIFAQKWGRQNMSLEKIYFALWMYTKAGEKEFLKSYIGLSSCHLTSTSRLVHQAGFNAACQLSPQVSEIGLNSKTVLKRPKNLGSTHMPVWAANGVRRCYHTQKTFMGSLIRYLFCQIFEIYNLSAVNVPKRCNMTFIYDKKKEIPTLKQK